MNNNGSIRWSRVMGWSYVAPGGSRSKEKRKKNGVKISGITVSWTSWSFPRCHVSLLSMETSGKTQTLEKQLVAHNYLSETCFPSQISHISCQVSKQHLKAVVQSFLIETPPPLNSSKKAKTKKQKHIKSGWHWNSNQKLREGFNKCIRTLKDQLNLHIWVKLSSFFFFFSCLPALISFHRSPLRSCFFLSLSLVAVGAFCDIRPSITSQSQLLCNQRAITTQLERCYIMIKNYCHSRLRNSHWHLRTTVKLPTFGY